MCVLVQMCPAVKPDVIAGTTLKKFGSIIWTLTTQPRQSLASTPHLFTHDAWKSTSSWVWGHQRWAWVGRNPTAEHGHSPRDEPWRMTANTRHMRAELDPREATPYPEFSCVRSGPPPRCLDAARSYSWLLRCWERREKSFNLALRFSPNTKRAEMTGAAVPGGVIT